MRRQPGFVVDGIQFRDFNGIPDHPPVAGNQNMQRGSTTRIFFGAVCDHYRFASGLKRIALIFVILGVLNFMAFLAFSLSIGGSAAAGKVLAGHYFVGEHGKLVEVGEWTFTISKILGTSLMVTWPMVIVGAVIIKSPSNPASGGRNGERRDR